jgi:hypothetical protein
MKKIIMMATVVFMSVLSAKAQDSTSIKAALDSLKMYVGKYKFGEGSPVSQVTVVIENGKLILKSAMGNADLEKAEGVDQFSIPAYQGTTSFYRNEAKKISGIHIDVMGRSLEGELVP